MKQENTNLIAPKNLFDGKQVFHLENTDFAIDDNLRPSALRKLNIKPELDKMVDTLPITDAFGLNWVAIKTLRLYRFLRPKSIEDRCVFEPSCSRYSELAFRQHGFWEAMKLTQNRLKKCKPGNGGTDLTELEGGDAVSR